MAVLMNYLSFRAAMNRELEIIGLRENEFRVHCAVELNALANY